MLRQVGSYCFLLYKSNLLKIGKHPYYLYSILIYIISRIIAAFHITKNKYFIIYRFII